MLPEPVAEQSSFARVAYGYRHTVLGKNVLSNLDFSDTNFYNLMILGNFFSFLKTSEQKAPGSTISDIHTVSPENGLTRKNKLFQDIILFWCLTLYFIFIHVNCIIFEDYCPRYTSQE